MLVYSNPRVPFGISLLVTKGYGISFLGFQGFNPCCKNICCKKDIFFELGRVCNPLLQSIIIFSRKVILLYKSNKTKNHLLKFNNKVYPLTVCNFPLLWLWTCDNLVDFKILWIFLYYEYYDTNISPGWENFGVTPKS